jgi:hypothetical protein
VAALYEQNNAAHIWYNAPSGTAGNAISFTQAMTLNASGRLGIGTTSPDSRLHVGPSNGAQLRIDFVSSGDNYYDGVTHYFRNGNGAANIMTLLNGGNVGIGTTSPNGRMTVVGNTVDIRNGAGGYGTGYALEFSTNANIPRIDWIDNGAYTGNIRSVSGEFIINNSSGNALLFQIGNTERMRITSGGNVEINTGSIKTGAPDTGWGRAAIKIGASVSGAAFNVTRYLPVSVDGTVYYINLNSSTP